MPAPLTGSEIADRFEQLVVISVALPRERDISKLLKR
jgi:hypothetical protein